MEYILSVILTILISLGIINMLGKKVGFYKSNYRQSDMHLILKQLIPDKQKTNVKKSQIQQRSEENKIQVVSVEDKAYWVTDNIFYTAILVNGVPDMSTVEPVNTSDMSKEDVDKMLFILDNLDRGNNERGSAGN